MTEKTEILPCPFCGSGDVDAAGWLDGHGNRGPECMSCGSTALTADAWNRRNFPEGLNDEMEGVLSLVRFLAETWTQVDRFVYEYCDGMALMKYPVVQGTRNQIDLATIGNQEYDKHKIRVGVDFMLAASPEPGGAE